MATKNDIKIFELQAELCQTLANPKRLQILNLLKDGELPVAMMIKEMEISKANLSQHLAVLRQKGILSARREGLTIYYKLALPKITEACGIMQDVLLESLREKEELSKTIRKSREPLKKAPGK